MNKTTEQKLTKDTETVIHARFNGTNFVGNVYKHGLRKREWWTFGMMDGSLQVNKDFTIVDFMPESPSKYSDPLKTSKVTLNLVTCRNWRCTSQQI